MELKEIKSKIAELKDKIIDNVDRHFNEEILTDIFDSGEWDIIDKPIDESDWYMYWKWVAGDLREIFYILFNKEENKTIDNLLHECLELKKLVDKNLTSNPHYDYDDLMEWFGVSNNTKTSDHIPLTSNDSLNSKIVNELYARLSAEGLIESQLENFKSHFLPTNSQPSPIKWIGTEIKVVALISLMIDNDIIPKSMREKRASIIVNHFINKKGEKFKVRQLSVSQSKFYNDEVQHLFEDINKIVNQLAEIN